MPLSPPVRAALTDLRTGLRAANDPALLPAMSIDTDEDARAWAAGVAPRLKALRAQTASALAAAQQAAAAEPAAGGDAGLRLAEEAFAKLEGELVAGTALKVRLAEGRRSMASKAERVVQEQLNVEVQRTGGKGVAALEAGGVARLREELPRWILAWADYAQQAYEVDTHRLIDRLWAGRDGDVAVPRPRFAPLSLPAAPPAPEFPTVTQSLDLEGLGGVLKHARAVLYGAMSLGVIFGLRPSSATGAGGTALMAAAAVAAFAFGYVQHRNEQAGRVERFEGEVARRAEQAVKAVLATWYDRQNDKLLEHYTNELHERRRALVQWYRVEVAPRKLRLDTDAADRKAKAEKARRDQAELERQVRELDKAEAALKPLLGA